MKIKIWGMWLRLICVRFCTSILLYVVVFSSPAHCTMWYNVFTESERYAF